MRMNRTISLLAVALIVMGLTGCATTPSQKVNAGLVILNGAMDEAERQILIWEDAPGDSTEKLEKLARVRASVSSAGGALATLLGVLEALGYIPDGTQASNIAEVQARLVEMNVAVNESDQ